MNYDNNMTGVLFKNNEKREGKRDADYRGQCEIDGQKFWLNAWIKSSKAGDKFMSLSFKAQEQRRGEQHKRGTTVEERASDFNDDIPF